MPRAITVRFPKGSESHRIWICCEDLSRTMSESGLGVLPMSEADSVVDRILIKEIKARQLKRCLSVVMQVLDRHHFYDVSVTAS